MTAPETPHAYMRHLISYISDDSTVAMHVNRNFGTKVKAIRVAEVRSQMFPPKKPRKDALVYHAGIEQSQAERRAIKGSTALLAAIQRAA